MKNAIVFIALVSIACGQELSLADRARKAKANAQAPPTMGRLENGDYFNDKLGFNFSRPDGWETLSRGQINMKQAMGRSALGFKAGVDSNGTEFMAHDMKGQNIVVSIRPMPADAPIATFKRDFQAALSQALPNPRFSAEPISLGDANHELQTFRLAYAVQGKEIFQSSQSWIVNGQMVQFLVTADPSELLTTTLKELRKHLIWRS